MKSIGIITSLVCLMLFTTGETNMTLVEDGLLFDKTEVSNNEWQQFEENLENSQLDIEKYRKNDVWDVDGFNRTYYSNSAYSEYPVVGITKFGAIEYCKWRNNVDRVNGTIRLPTKSEFLNAISEGEKSIKWYKKKLIAEEKGLEVANFYNSSYAYNTTLNTKSSLPNKFGIYNITGNVSEMVQEDNVVVGGSWRDKNDRVWSKVFQEYSEPTDWIGFRCVCELNSFE